MRWIWGFLSSGLVLGEIKVKVQSVIAMDDDLTRRYDEVDLDVSLTAVSINGNLLSYVTSIGDFFIPELPEGTSHLQLSHPSVVYPEFLVETEYVGEVKKYTIFLMEHSGQKNSAVPEPFVIRPQAYITYQDNDGFKIPGILKHPIFVGMVIMFLMTKFSPKPVPQEVVSEESRLYKSPFLEKFSISPS